MLLLAASCHVQLTQPVRCGACCRIMRKRWFSVEPWVGTVMFQLVTEWWVGWLVGWLVMRQPKWLLHGIPADSENPWSRGLHKGLGCGACWQTLYPFYALMLQLCLNWIEVLALVEIPADIPVVFRFVFTTLPCSSRSSDSLYLGYDLDDDQLQNHFFWVAMRYPAISTYDIPLVITSCQLVLVGLVPKASWQSMDVVRNCISQEWMVSLVSATWNWWGKPHW